MLSRARDLGMEALAITDHGPTLKGRVSTTFYDRLHEPVPGIRLLKGMECNLTDTDGTIDMTNRALPWCDVVLLGVHPNTSLKLGSAAWTDMLVRAMDRYPYLDIITHPNSDEYPLELDRLAREAAARGVALELNNSKTHFRRVDDAVTIELIGSCAKHGCTMAVCSDAHALNEIGDDSAVAPLLQQVGFPQELIVNATAEGAFAWVDGRRSTKLANSGNTAA
jgi:putative hydrolase